MNRDKKAFVLGGFLVWMWGASPLPSQVQPGELHVALSLRELQEHLRSGTLDPESALPLQNLEGVFLEARDIVLLGKGPGRIPISADDIVLALRAMWLSDEPPGVSIDPRPDPQAPSGMGPWQDVVYFGGIEGTRAGLYAFTSDYWMKRLAAGDISVPLPGFKRYVDLALQGAPSWRPAANRFWFYPAASEIVVSRRGDLMLFERHGIEVLTEVEHSSFNQQKTFDLFLGQDHHAEEFAHSFTERYDELAHYHQDLARLKSFFALCEIFRWCEVVGLPTGRIRWDDWLYLLHAYQPVPTHSTPQVRTVETFHWRGSIGVVLVGGVSAEIRLPKRPTVDSTGRLSRLADELRQRRPDGALVWNYEPQASSGDPGEAIRRALREQQDLMQLRRSFSEQDGVLGLEPLADGRIAALVEQSGRRQLLHIDTEQVEIIAAGPQAAEKLDAVARDVCRRASDAHVVFVHLRRRNDHGILQIGVAEPVELPMSRLLAAARGQEPYRSTVGRLFPDGGEAVVIYRDGRSLARRGPASTALDDPSLWAAALQQILDRCCVYVSSDTRRARRNQRQLGARGRLQDWAVFVPREHAGLDPVQLEWLRDRLKSPSVHIATTEVEIGDTPNWILLSDLRGDELVAFLRSMGQRKLLAGRLIVLLSPLDPAVVEDLLSRYGAAGIHHPMDAVQPKAAERAIEMINTVRQETENNLSSPSEILRQAVDKALENGGPWRHGLARMNRSPGQI